MSRTISDRLDEGEEVREIEFTSIDLT